jgi:hypothetical protein
MWGYKIVLVADEVHQILVKNKDIHWNLGSRTPLFMNSSVHEQIFQAKNVSDDERCLGLRTRKLATAVGDKLRVSARECHLLVNFVSVHIPA